MHCNETQCCGIDGAAAVIQPNERHLPLLLTRSQGDDGCVPGRTEGVVEEERVAPPRRRPGTAPPRVLADQDRAAPTGPRRLIEIHARLRHRCLLRRRLRRLRRGQCGGVRAYHYVVTERDVQST
ncbi:hypothetical protein B296_00030927 [Ensete ventricosum]|uniref:Uncharacterized protein n=1 Tax=Ensete ventricosum TaxID=4639 RepID=A0A427AHP0_ENSVE|nr:hypothetical protein B296_00030927 [Ensete ventricosum]